MDKIFVKALEEAKSQVKITPDSQLNLEQLTTITFAKYSFDILELNLTTLNIIIDKEVLHFQNAPQGFSFSPGSQFDYVIYQISYQGNYVFIDKIIHGIQVTHGNIYREGNYIVIKLYSQFEIINNEAEKNRLKEIAKECINSLTKRINSLNSEIEEFNKLLNKTILEEMNNEKQRRDDLKNAKNNLNPFS